MATRSRPSLTEIMALIDGPLLKCFDPTPDQGKAIRACIKRMAEMFSRGRYSKRKGHIGWDRLSAGLYEAGDIAEQERLGNLQPEEARMKLWRMARRMVATHPRRYSKRRDRLARVGVRWGHDLPSKPGEPSEAYPVEPDIEYLMSFAFWKMVNAVEVRTWVRFKLRHCEAPACETQPLMDKRVEKRYRPVKWFIEGDHGKQLNGGRLKRCPKCLSLGKSTKKRKKP